jgi:hypothetical protein
MTRKEEKDLLFKYLCMALPYGFIVHRYSDNVDIKINTVDGFSHFLEYSNDEKFKPYLRPMSSMTDEEATEYANCGNIIAISHQNDYLIPNPKSIQYLLENHFDFMGLIPKGLAIEVTKDNNPYK